MKQGWEYKKLGEVCEITMGQSPEGSSINESEGVEFHQGKTYFGERYLGQSGIFTVSPSKLAKAHSVLLCVRAPVGFPNITEREICIGRGLCSVVPEKNIDNTYLFYSLIGKQDYFEKNATGSTFKAISSKVVNNTVITLPPIPIQQSIVAELDEINNLLSLKRKELETYDKLAQSLFYEMFGDPVENEKGWEVKKLNEVSTLLNGRAYKQNELLETGKYKVLRVGNFFTNGNYYYSDLELEEEKYCNNGDLLFAWSASFGAFIWNEEKVIYHYHIWKVLYDDAKLNIQYYRFLLNTMASYFMKDVHGIGMVHLTKNGMEQYDIPLPPLPLQQLFATRIEAIEAQKANVKAAIEKLETLLAARMQYWFE